MLQETGDRSISRKVDEMMGGTQAPATFLLPFSPTRLYSCGTGLLFSPDVMMQRMYKENAYTWINDYNPRYKNHANLYSFLTKLSEQAWFDTERGQKGSRLIQHSSSGHIAANGLMTSGKQKEKLLSSPVQHNEVVVQWSVIQNSLLAVVINLFKPFDQNMASSLIELIRSLSQHGFDLNVIPVIRYRPASAEFTCLGSAHSAQNVACTSWLLPFQIPDICHNFFTTLDLQINRFRSEGHEKFSGSNCLQHFCSAYPASIHYDINNIVTPGYFHDNLQKLCDGLPGEADRSFLIALNVVAQRQLLEFYGVSFSDEESLLLTLAAVILYCSQQKPGLIQEFISLIRSQGVSSLLISFLEQAMTSRVAAGDHRDRVLLYQSILFNGLGVSQTELPFVLAANAEMLHREQSQTRDCIFNYCVQLPALALKKGHTWPALLKDLQNRYKMLIAQQLRERNIPLQCWPYAEIALVIPTDLCVLELVSDQRAALRLCPLIEYYAQSGCPRFLGTITKELVTQPFLDTLCAEVDKKNSIPSTPVCPIPLRAWEIAPDPLSELSPLENLL